MDSKINEKISLTDQVIAEYRAWDIRNSKMVYDALQLMEIRQLVTVNADYFNSPFSFFDGCKWMQFTEKKDRNGKKIFAGDIVRYNHSTSEYNFPLDFIGVVQWNKEKCKFETSNEPGVDLSWEMIEVIGNVYENPDLIPV